MDMVEAADVAEFDPENEPMSDQQATWLNDMGILPAAMVGLTYAQASALIDENKIAFAAFKLAHDKAKPAFGRQRLKASEIGLQLPPCEFTRLVYLPAHLYLPAI